MVLAALLSCCPLHGQSLLTLLSDGVSMSTTFTALMMVFGSGGFLSSLSLYGVTLESSFLLTVDLLTAGEDSAGVAFVVGGTILELLRRLLVVVLEVVFSRGFVMMMDSGEGGASVDFLRPHRQNPLQHLKKTSERKMS